MIAAAMVRGVCKNPANISHRTNCKLTKAKAIAVPGETISGKHAESVMINEDALALIGYHATPHTLLPDVYDPRAGTYVRQKAAEKRPCLKSGSADDGILDDENGLRA